MPTYNKLVRDKIPEIIKGNNKKYNIIKLDDNNYVQKLRNKFQEEVSEYLESTSDKNALEELADILEIIHSLSLIHNSNFEKVEFIRQKKLKERGGFTKKNFLVDVED